MYMFGVVGEARANPLMHRENMSNFLMNSPTETQTEDHLALK